MLIRARLTPCPPLLSRKTDMDCHVLIILICTVLAVSGWSAPFYPVHRAPNPLRVTRYAPHPPQHRIPIREEEVQWQRPKRDHEDYDDHEKAASGVTGPVHTFVKTDKNANYKWGVRHHVGNKYAA